MNKNVKVVKQSKQRKLKQLKVYRNRASKVSKSKIDPETKDHPPEKSHKMGTGRINKTIKTNIDNLMIKMQFHDRKKTDLLK